MEALEQGKNISSFADRGDISFRQRYIFFLSLQDVCIGLHCRLCASVCSFASIISGFDRLIKLKRFASVTYLNGVK